MDPLCNNVWNRFAITSPRDMEAFFQSHRTDNHDIISLKLYQLTVLRSEKEEEEEEEEITIPSVDNIELLRRKTHALLLPVAPPFASPPAFL